MSISMMLPALAALLRSRTTRLHWGFSIWLLASSLASAALAENCGSPIATRPGTDFNPYPAHCSSKSECTTSDTLIIGPKLKELDPLRQVDLVLNGFCHVLVTLPAQRAVPDSLSIPLAPVIARWLKQDTADAVVRPYFQGNDVKVLIDTVMHARSGETYRTTLMLDVTSLWKDGVLGWGDLGGKEISASLNRSMPLPVMKNLGGWRKAVNSDYKNISLSIDGTVIPGLQAIGDDGQGSLMFRLARDDNNRAQWQPVIETAMSGQALPIAIVDQSGRVLAGKGNIRLDVMSYQKRLAVLSVCALILLVMVISIGQRTEWSWLRDDYGIPIKDLPINQRPFSMGRLQMLFWMFIFVVATLAVLTVFLEMPDFTGKAFVLMGIGLGTGVASAAITPTVVTNAHNEYAANAITREELARRIGSKSFFSDIFRDYKSQSADFHRIQVFALTIGVGAFFLVLAFKTGQFPNIDGLMTVTGLSGAGYVGYKFTNN